MRGALRLSVPTGGTERLAGMLQYNVAFDLVDMRGELVVQDHVHQQTLDLVSVQGELSGQEGHCDFFVRAG